MVASTMPPSKDFVGLVSEYVHTVAHNEAEDPSVKVMAQSTWSSLKRSAKAGARRTVRPQQDCDLPHLVDQHSVWQAGFCVARDRPQVAGLQA